MSLFDDTNRRLSAIAELCYVVTNLAVQAYNAVLLDSEVRIKFLGVRIKSNFLNQKFESN